MSGPAKELHRVWLEAMFRAPEAHPAPPGSVDRGPRPSAPRLSVGRLSDWFSEDHALHQNLVATLPRGPAGVRLATERLGRALDEWVFTIDGELRDGAVLFTSFSARARHVGRLGPVRATGRTLFFEGMLMSRLGKGKAIETWLEVDAWSLLAGLGAIEPVPEALADPANQLNELEPRA